MGTFQELLGSETSIKYVVSSCVQVVVLVPSTHPVEQGGPGAVAGAGARVGGGAGPAVKGPAFPVDVSVFSPGVLPLPTPQQGQTQEAAGDEERVAGGVGAGAGANASRVHLMFMP